MHAMRVIVSCLGYLVVVLATLPATAQGYFSGSNGARAAGRAGAFTARADDLSAVIFNPAGLAKVETTLVQIGNRASYNSYSFSRTATPDWAHLDANGVAPLVSFATVNNEVPWQWLDPMVGVASNLGLKDWGFALAAYAPAGIGREQFPVDGGQRYMMVSRETQVINYSANVAWKYGDLFGIGTSLQWISVPKLRYQLVIDANTFSRRVSPVWSELDMLADVSGSDLFTFNAVLGAWLRPIPELEFGLSAQVVPSELNIKGTLKVDPLSKNIVDSVQLVRGAIQRPANDVTLTLPLPITIRKGVRYRHLKERREVFDIELDIAYEFWSRVQKFSLDTKEMHALFIGQDLRIGQIDIQKHWRDTITVALGGDVNVLPEDLTLRGGVFYTSAVADPSFAQVDFVGGQQLGGALGMSLFFDNIEVAVAYDYRTQLPVSVTESQSKVYQQVPGSPCVAPYTDLNTCSPNYLGRPSAPANAGSYRSYSHAGTLDLLYRFK
jgi:long-chain fatty acid transport protein